MESDHDAAAFRTRELLLEMKGELVWFVRLSADNVLRADFGSPHLKIREPSRPAPGRSQVVVDALERRIVNPRGKWHLYIAEAIGTLSPGFTLATDPTPTANKSVLHWRSLMANGSQMSNRSAMIGFWNSTSAALSV